MKRRFSKLAGILKSWDGEKGSVFGDGREKMIMVRMQLIIGFTLLRLSIESAAVVRYCVD